MHAGVWDKSSKGAHEVRGRTLGIVGYGNIGSQLSVVAESIGMRVLFYDVADKLALGNARRCDTLDELLAEAETVSLHVDGRHSNAGLFGEAEFAKMRPRSLFLNLCRGIVVDHDALREHLSSGHIAGAALDVFADEPNTVGDPFASSLRGLPNVILTPHIGGSTEEAQVDIGRFVAGQAARLRLQRHQHACRSTSRRCRPKPATAPASCTSTTTCPGSWPGSTACWATRGVNIEGQVLSTRGELGYVITDVGGRLSRRGVRPAPSVARNGSAARHRLSSSVGLICLNAPGARPARRRHQRTGAGSTAGSAGRPRVRASSTNPRR